MKNWKALTQRILPLLLAVVLIAGVVPATTQAADDYVYYDIPGGQLGFNLHDSYAVLGGLTPGSSENVTAVEIPAYVAGLPVQVILPYCFSGLEKLKSVTIPSQEIWAIRAFLRSTKDLRDWIGPVSARVSAARSKSLIMAGRLS